MASLSELRRWLLAGERSMAQAAVLTVAPRARRALAAAAAAAPVMTTYNKAAA